MFEIMGYAGKDMECPHCEKVTECLAVKCKLGTFEGPICPKCLTKQCKIRSAGAKNPQPQPNGVPTAHEVG